MLALLRSLISDFRVSGRESGDGAVNARLAATTDEIWRDRAGNFVGLIRGAGINKKKIMLQTHMDGAGFVVTDAEENGDLRFCPSGNFSLRSAAYTEAVTARGVRGIITPAGAKGGDPGELSNDSSAYIFDIGAENRAAALRRVGSGEFFAPVPHLTVLGTGKNRLFSGFPIDGRAGAAVLLKCCENLMADRPQDDIYIVFAIEGHNNFRLAGTAAASILPDEAMAMGSTDVLKPGDGAVITVQRKNFVADEVLTARLREVAEREKIPYKVGVSGSAPAPGMRIQSEGAGTPTAELDLPLSRLHTVSETVAERDMLAAARLAEAFCRG